MTDMDDRLFSFLRALACLFFCTRLMSSQMHFVSYCYCNLIISMLFAMADISNLFQKTNEKKHESADTYDIYPKVATQPGIKRPKKVKCWNKSSTKIKSPNKNQQTNKQPQQQRISVNRNAMNYYVYVCLPFFQWNTYIHISFVCSVFVLLVRLCICPVRVFVLCSISSFFFFFWQLLWIWRSFGVCNEVLNRWVHALIEPRMYIPCARVVCACAVPAPRYICHGIKLRSSQFLYHTAYL